MQMSNYSAGALLSFFFFQLIQFIRVFAFVWAQPLACVALFCIANSIPSSTFNWTVTLNAWRFPSFICSFHLLAPIPNQLWLMMMLAAAVASVVPSSWSVRHLVDHLLCLWQNSRQTVRVYWS